MLKKLAIAVIALMFLAPTLGLVTVGLVMNPAVIACLSSSGHTLGTVPDSLLVTTANGETFTLSKQQLTHAATIITVGSRVEGVTRDGIQIAIMAALTESTLRQLANTRTYPESGDFPNDGNGSDHDSLGPFQMRPQSGWGSAAELMDPQYQAAAFFGGPSGPNYPSPRGLLDIPGWQSMGKGEAAQAVEVSAYPDRYNNYEPVAEKILTTLASGTSPSSTPAPPPPGAVTKSSPVVFPLPEGSWVLTGDFGPRVDPFTGESAFHSGTDLAATAGTHILAAADGLVTVAEVSGSYGGLIVIEHRIDGEMIATAYAHMWENGIHSTAGEYVVAGQYIGDVGSAGRSTGSHLHFEVRPGGTNAAAVDGAKWLNDHDAAALPEATAGAGCSAIKGGR
ncbi:M23 family metallopeptidase [Salinibacterium sp. UTAS2018]|nr:M23 family metallopeptidase [Salinibacterium sp. UTAS2018]